MVDALLARVPAELTDGRTSLRLITPADWAVEVALSAVPDVLRWTRYPSGLDEVDARARIEVGSGEAAAGNGGRYVIREVSGAVAGTAGIAMNGRHAPEVFYALLPAGRGRGLATAAAAQLTEWALGVGHDVVLLMTMVGNAPSEAVAQRAGFAPVAVETVGDGGTVHLWRWERRAPGTRVGCVEGGPPPPA